MKRYYALILTGLAMALLATCASCAYSLRNTKGESGSDRAVAIYVLCDGGISGGSGVILDSNHVLTAAHVVECPSEAFVMVRTADGIDYEAVVDDQTVTADVARLRTDKALPYRSKVKIALPPVEGGIVCAYTAIPKRTTSCGVIEPSERVPPGNVQFSAIVIPGNSGSGLYDERGRLVGVVTHYYQCGPGRLCGGLGTSIGDRAWIAYP